MVEYSDHLVSTRITSSMPVTVDDLVTSLETVLAGVDALKADNERLRAALANVRRWAEARQCLTCVGTGSVGGVRCLCEGCAWPDIDVHVLDMCAAIAKDALEGEG